MAKKKKPTRKKTPRKAILTEGQIKRRARRARRAVELRDAKPAPTAFEVRQQERLAEGLASDQARDEEAEKKARDAARDKLASDAIKAAKK